MNYKQLTQEERYQIYALMKANHNQKNIANILGRSASSISREIKRNKGLKGYRPKQAQRLMLHRRVTASKSIKITNVVKGWIEDLLFQDLTPEQIAGRLALEGKIQLHHESIYRYIYQDKANGGHLYQKLTRACKKYKKRYGSYDKRGQLVNRISIDERPDIVDSKSRIGDWEGDTVIGKGRKNAFVTMVERKTLFTVVKRIESKHADITADALIASMMHLKASVHTITLDNGKEFAQHERIGNALDVSVYFAHPYSSWERGINENTNGLLRRYFPKGTDFMMLSEEEIQTAVNKLNHRPRKTRGYKTPYELFTGQSTKLVAA
ncbi:IS30 family transposase [uncultured Psychromonas sp.]|uniref:IS30 family transposase n=1 Tax=uncultured Psychromonas sp. TaxID=173974 RepID=UPI002631CBE4|nr:IS30 family transposase [uncultured Psychromonas sp.]